MLVKELERYLLSVFPAEDAESWDHIGLSVGDPDCIVTGVACALDATKANIERAHEVGANVLLTHHPVYIKAPQAFVPNAGEHPASSSAVFTAVRLGVSVISLHTNLDRSDEARQLLAARMGATPTSSLEYANDPIKHGLGLVASIEATCLVDLVKLTGDAFSTEPRVWGNANAPISRIAVLGGSLGDFGELALHADADAIITGEAGYHVCQDLASRGCCVVLLGHDRSEEPFVDILADSAERAGISRERIVTINHHDQWWTYTKGERS